MSVQYSRIRSLTLDQLKTHELLVSFYIVPPPITPHTRPPTNINAPTQIALFMGNDVLNEIMEANLTDIKPIPESTK